MSLAGKTVLIWSEQGVGNHILYGGLLASILNQAGHCIFECDARLAPAFQRAFPHQAVVAAVAKPDARTLGSDIDVQIPLAGLMRVIPGWPEGFARQERYLEPDAVFSAKIEKRLVGAGVADRKIGIAWQSTRKRVGPKKSAPRALWEPILAHRDCSFINLQYGDTDAETAAAEHDIGIQIYSDPNIDRLNDLDALFALIDGLELVITTSNITAHLAASLGKPCWLMLRANPPWYWGRDGREVLFYPTVRAFRQREPGEWQPVIAEIAEALSDWLAAKD